MQHKNLYASMRGKKEKQDLKPIKKMMGICSYVIIITTNINVLNSPTERHMTSKRMKKQYRAIWCLQNTDFTEKTEWMEKC